MEKPNNVIVHLSTQTLLKTLFILGAVALLYFLRDAALIVLAAVVIASAIEPVIQWFIKRKIPRTITAIAA